MVRRIGWLLIFVSALGWPITKAFQQVHREAAIRKLLLEVQAALQNYHVDQERYIPREKLTGTEMISVLSDFGFLSTLPLNPWSGVPWKLDGREPDHLVYETDQRFETYSLKAIDAKNGTTVLELDSEENQSLE